MDSLLTELVQYMTWEFLDNASINCLVQTCKKFTIIKPIDSKQICAQAANEGYLKIIEWAYDLGAHCDQNVAINAASNGHIDVLHWYLQKRFIWHDYKIRKAAAQNAQIDVLIYLRQNKKLEQCDMQHIMQVGLNSGHINIVEWCLKNDCKWDNMQFHLAAHNGHLHIIKWAHQNGVTIGNGIFTYATYGCHMHILKWAIKYLDLPEGFCDFAAHEGNLPIFMWARENGAQWNEFTCYNAAIMGHFHVLDWAYDNGAPIHPFRVNKNTVPNATDRNQLKQWFDAHNIRYFD